MDAELIGLDALIKEFSKLKQVPDTKKIESELLSGPAASLKNQIKNNAPLGPTGRLKKSIVNKPFSRKQKENPKVFVTIDRKMAPHAHLVEFGHKGPHPAPPHPFFRPVVDSQKSNIMGKIREIIWRAIKAEADNG